MGQRGPLIALALALWAATASAAPRDPQAIAIVLDRSAQMSGDRLSVAKQAVLDLVDGLDRGDRIAVVAFGARATVVATMQAPSHVQLASALDALSSDGPGTNLAAGLDAAFDQLAAARIRDRRVIVVTGSEDMSGVGAVLARHHELHASVATLAIGIANPVALEELYRCGPVRAIDDLIELRGALADALPPRKSSTPRAVAFVIDRSGSMSEGDKLERAKFRVRAMMAKLPPDTIVSVVAFDSEAMVLSRPMPARFHPRIALELARLQCEGGTNIYTGLKEAYEILQEQRGERRLVLLTDGGGEMDGISELLADTRAAHIVTDVIGFEANYRDTLAQIASEGDGTLDMIDEPAP